MNTVHIWRFLTMNSIDVEIWEERSGRKVGEVEGYKI